MKFSLITSSVIIIVRKISQSLLCVIEKDAIIDPFNNVISPTINLFNFFFILLIVRSLVLTKIQLVYLGVKQNRTKNKIILRL